MAAVADEFSSDEFDRPFETMFMIMVFAMIATFDGGESIPFVTDLTEFDFLEYFVLEVINSAYFMLFYVMMYLIDDHT